jgi:hypothetical protein
MGKRSGVAVWTLVCFVCTLRVRRGLCPGLARGVDGQGGRFCWAQEGAYVSRCGGEAPHCPRDVAGWGFGIVRGACARGEREPGVSVAQALSRRPSGRLSHTRNTGPRLQRLLHNPPLLRNRTTNPNPPQRHSQLVHPTTITPSRRTRQRETRDAYAGCL